MSFTTAAALWLLLPFILLLAYRLRRRQRRRVPVGTLGIWRALAERQPSSRSRPRPPLDFLLEAMLGLLLILLAAGPTLVEEAPTEVVVLVDHGSAMSTPKRQEALQSALVRIEDASGRSPLLRFEPQSPGAGPVATDDLLWRPRLSALRSRRREVWLVADSIADFEDLPDDVGIIVIDAPLENVGITAAAMEAGDEHGVIFVALAATTGIDSQGLSLRASGADGRVLAERPLVFPVGRTRTSLELPLTEDPGARIVLSLLGPSGASFDDRVELQRSADPVRPLLLPFEGAPIWAAALEAAGHRPIRGVEAPSVNDSGTFVLIRPGPVPAGSAAIVPAAVDLPSGLAAAVDPAIVGQPLQVVEGEALADLPGPERLGGASGSCFQVEDVGLRVLARRGGRAVIVFDSNQRLILLADPESASAWRDEAPFPVLVSRLMTLVLAEEGGGGWRAGPLSSPGETEGLATDSRLTRPARPAPPDRRPRPLQAECAVLALILLGILAFLRIRAAPRRESARID